MEVTTDFAQTLEIKKRAYDEVCKEILAERQVRAHILKDYVPEFAHSSLDEILALLGDEVEIGSEPVGRYKTAANTEDATLHEGTARFDVRFSVPIPESTGEVSVEIDLEAQSKWNVGYPLLSRAVFYCARLLSAQGKRILSKSKYGSLHKVYSLWVCTHPDGTHKGLVDHFEIRPNNQSHANLYQGYDLMRISMICLDRKHVSADDGCLGLLGTLFLHEGEPQEVKRILSEDFGMILSESIDERVVRMCNLSEGVWEDGIAAGRAEGRAAGRAEGRAEGRAAGRAEGRAESLASLMQQLSIPLARAMELLGIPSEQEAEYAQLIAQPLA